MTLKTMLFEIILTAVSIVGLYESWSYLNGVNIEDYSQVDFTDFVLLMISGTMFAAGFIYLLVDVDSYSGEKRRLNGFVDTVFSKTACLEAKIQRTRGFVRPQ